MSRRNRPPKHIREARRRLAELEAQAPAPASKPLPKDTDIEQRVDAVIAQTHPGLLRPVGSAWGDGPVTWRMALTFPPGVDRDKFGADYEALRARVRAEIQDGDRGQRDAVKRVDAAAAYSLELQAEGMSKGVARDMAGACFKVSVRSIQRREK